MSEHRKTDGTVTVKGADGKIIGNVAAEAIQNTPNSVTVSVTISLEEQDGAPDTAALNDLLGMDPMGDLDHLVDSLHADESPLSEDEENSYWEMHTDAASDVNAPAYFAANEERRARIRREIEDKPLMNYKYAYCPDCGQQVRVIAVRDSVTAASHEGCPYGHLRREVEFDHDRQCADIVVGDDEGEPLNGYIALWREHQAEVYAKTTFDAQQFAVAEFGKVSGRRKVHPSDITVVLAEKGGSTVTHSGDIF